MPKAAPRPCTAPCCRALATQDGRCVEHQREAWSKKAKATKRITGRRLQAMRKDLFMRFPLCAECERLGRPPREATQRDHIKPLFEGGADDSSNEQGLCDECHDIKSAAEAERARHVGAQETDVLKIWANRRG